MAWPANVILALKYENNKTDDTGTYTTSDVGTPVYSSGVKHNNNYALSHVGVNGADHHIAVENQIITDLAALDEFSVSCQHRHDSSQRYAYIWGKGADPFNAAGTIADFTDRVGNDWLLVWNGVIYNLGNWSSADDNTFTNLAWTWKTGTPADPTAVGTLKSYKDNNLIGTQAGIVSSLQANNTDFRAGGRALTSLTSGYYQDNFVVTNTIPASFPVKSSISLPFGVNINGGEFEDSEGFTWLADQIYSQGINDYGSVATYSLFSDETAVTNTVDDTLYYSCRYSIGTMKYYIKVPNGTYNVYIGLQSYDIAGSEQRAVDIYVGEKDNTSLVSDYFDVYVEAGNTSYGACGGLRSTQQENQPYEAVVTNGVLEVGIAVAEILGIMNNIYIEEKVAVASGIMGGTADNNRLGAKNMGGIL